jgi:hypothetical protein
MKKAILVALIVFACSVTLQAQDFRFVSWEDVDYLSENGAILRYDKLEHLVGSMGLCGMLEFYSEEHGWKYALLAGLLWELKDGFYEYETYGSYGGEGFDFFGDLVCDGIGVAIWRGLSWIWDSIFGPN